MRVDLNRFLKSADYSPTEIRDILAQFDVIVKFSSADDLPELLVNFNDTELKSVFARIGADEL